MRHPVFMKPLCLFIHITFSYDAIIVFYFVLHYFTVCRAWSCFAEMPHFLISKARTLYYALLRLDGLLKLFHAALHVLFHYHASDLSFYYAIFGRFCESEFTKEAHYSMQLIWFRFSDWFLASAIILHRHGRFIMIALRTEFVMHALMCHARFAGPKRFSPYVYSLL